MAHRGSDVAHASASFVRNAATWYAYLMLGFFGFMLNLQGNIVPLLKAELGLSYGTVGLHASALAGGMMTTGLTGAPLLGRVGRRRGMWLGAVGLMLGAALLCLARHPALSIGACALIGAVGGLVPVVVASALADLHGERRDVAYIEANAASYLFSLLGPLGIGAALAIGIDWRFALVAGVALGLLVVAGFRRVRLPDSPLAHVPAHGALTIVYWTYWATLALGVAIEYCVLLWAPEFLERVAGMSRSAAAVGAGAFMVAMIAGRLAGSRLLSAHPAGRLLRAALLVTLVGFAVYWGLGDASRVSAAWAAAFAIAGLFLTGVGIAPIYPLTLALAVRSAGSEAALASARTTLASGGAILVMPALLGRAADDFGLSGAMLIVPVLAALALASAICANRLALR
ncbi:MAG TPA: MFS transporter [Burkholderiaceae bacterium]|nr:MFS transporter [Burkholderiaceae bacterium]